MLRQTIAVDIDDVLSNFAQELIDISNKKWGTNLTLDDYTEHWGEMWKVDEKTVKKRSDELHSGSLALSLKHVPDARPVLKKLSRNYNLVLVTSRRRLITEETKIWIDKFFKEVFDDLHFTGFYDTKEHASLQIQGTKVEILKQINANYLIDDQPKHCLAAAKAGVVSVLYGEYPWNENVTLTKNMVRAKNWQEVLEYFDAES